MASASALNLLLVEDNSGDVYLFREVLKKLKVSYNLEVLDDGASALTYFDRIAQGEKDCPDIIVLDLNLPKVEGTDVLQRFKQLDCCCKTLVIVFTSSNSPRDRAEALKLGADAYFEKPLHLDEYMRVGETIISMCMERKGLN